MTDRYQPPTKLELKREAMKQRLVREKDESHEKHDPNLNIVQYGEDVSIKPKNENMSYYIDVINQYKPKNS